MTKTLDESEKVLINENIFHVFFTIPSSSVNCSQNDVKIFIWEFYYINNKSVPFYQVLYNNYASSKFILPGLSHPMYQKVVKRKFHGAEIVAAAGVSLCLY